MHPLDPPSAEPSLTPLFPSPLQSAFHPELRTIEQRFVWAYKRSSAMMLATSLTTCICLGLTAISTIPTVRSFGIFGSFLVLVDYIQVITWFPAVVVCKLLPFERQTSGRSCCVPL